MRLVCSLISTAMLLGPSPKSAAEIELKPAPSHDGTGSNIGATCPETPEDPAPRSGIVIDARKPEPRPDKTEESRGGYPARRSRARAVAGYLGSLYVYGEVRMLGGKRVAGYIYRLNGRNVRNSIYIYGERVGKDGVAAYDTQGNYYALKLLARPSP